MSALLLGEHYPEADLLVLSSCQSLVSLAELERRMAEAGARTATPSARLDPVGMPREAIRVAGVQFGYPRAGRLVFTGLDLELPAGRSTAVVCINGAGKTTLPLRSL